jgi:hypothetical protein
MQDVLLLQQTGDPATNFQHGLLLEQKPVKAFMLMGRAKLLVGNQLTRENVLRELQKPYKIIYIGAHGNDLRIRGHGRNIILTPQDADLFRGKKVYAYVCNSADSGMFRKADEFIGYHGKFSFPNPDTNPVYRGDIQVWNLLQLGFYPINRSLEMLLRENKISMRKVFNEMPGQFDKAFKEVTDESAKRTLLGNLNAIRYSGNGLSYRLA